jgi:hypothetical protein
LDLVLRFDNSEILKRLATPNYVLWSHAKIRGIPTLKFYFCGIVCCSLLKRKVLFGKFT